ncbi:MAG: hypothetical protein A2Y33_16505 [Spirochaetes bacterium GWF1_51_8]|nr:MAG: hypothetical protein A2Y33_16505 [Spirochaetes bacterium GWF1_51_8]
MPNIKELIKKFVKDDYFRNTVILFVFTMATNVLQYVYKIFANRNLSKDEYGLLGALLSLIQLIAIGSSVLKMWSTKVFSQIHSYSNHREIGGTFRFFFLIIGGFSAILILLFFIFLDPLMKYYKAVNIVPFIFALGILMLEYIKIPFNSFLESFNIFMTRSIALFSLVAIKVVFLAVFLFIGFDLTAAMITVLTGYIGAFLLFAVFSLPKVTKIDMTREDSPGKKITQRSFTFLYKIGIAIFFGTLLQAFDMQIARGKFEEALSGDFATARDLGSIIYWIGTITLPLFFVSINNVMNKKQNFLPVFLKGMGIVIVVTGAGLATFLIGIKPFVNLYNPIYLSAVDTIRYYAISTVPYILITFMTNFFISLDRYKVFIPLTAMVAGQIALFYFFGTNATDLITIRFLSGLAILLFIVIYFLVMRKKFVKTGPVELSPVPPIEEETI